MAKGDKRKVENQIQTQGNTTQTGLNQVRTNTLQPEHGEMFQNYQNAANQQKQDYGNIMGQYQGVANNPSAINFNPVNAAKASYTRSPEMAHAMGTYGEFANTGGYSNQNIQDLRARGISPIRSVYANAVQNLDRQRALQGGYSPNYTASVAKMSGELGRNLADQTTNVNAGLAEAINRGRLSGASGLGGLATSDSDFANRTSLANANAQNQVGMFNSQNAMQGQQANAARQLQGIQGQQSLYGTSPAAAATFGNQVLDSSGQLLNAQDQQGQLGSNIVNQQTQAAQLPSNFDTALGRAGKIGQIGSQVISPFLGGGSFADPGRFGGQGSVIRPQDIFQGGVNF